jgi:hypothetical protein
MLVWWPVWYINEETKYMHMPHHQNTAKNQTTKKQQSPEIVTKVKIWSRTTTIQNNIVDLRV